MVKNIAGSNAPPDKSRRAVATFKPTPVLVTTPMMIPAVAQAIRTPRTPMEPSIKPCTPCLKVIRVAERKLAQQMLRRIAAKAARIGVKPLTSK